MSSFDIHSWEKLGPEKSQKDLIVLDPQQNKIIVLTSLISITKANFRKKVYDLIFTRVLFGTLFKNLQSGDSIEGYILLLSFINSICCDLMRFNTIYQ